MTLANKITLFRLVASIVYLAFIAYFISIRRLNSIVLDTACVVFFALALLDTVDGMIARWMNETTKIGRILDPLVDKLSIGGTFILFLGIMELNELITPWIVLILIAREFYVSAIRAFAEEAGIAFPANHWGKFKTFIESAVIIGCYLYISHLNLLDSSGNLLIVLKSMIGVMLFSVTFSAIIYTIQFFNKLKEKANEH